MSVNDKIKARARWYIEYERIITEAIPALSGKLCWDTAAYFYNSGNAPIEAAQKVITRWQECEHEVLS